MAQGRSSAPAAPRAVPSPRQTLGNQHLAERVSFSHDGSKLARAGRSKARSFRRSEGPEAGPSPPPLDPFRLAPGRAQLGRVNVGNPDLLAPEPEGITIHHTIVSRAVVAERKGCGKSASNFDPGYFPP